MNPDRWKRIEQIYHRALEIGPDERAALLDRECGTDLELRREVEDLLDASAEADNFLVETALIDAASLGTNRPRLQPGDTIDRYQILSEIGSGGMGDVYLARDTRLGRHVAVKMLSAEVPRGGTERQRLLREARAAAALNHPNIVTVHTVEETDDAIFIVMEFVEGRTLADLCARREVTFELALDIGAQIADALAAAHEAGLVHRDVKPANILVRPNGQAKLLDFGIAKALRPLTDTSDGRSHLTADGTILGTVAYMSPEQVYGETLDGRSDVFSLGTVLYEVATGRLPFAGRTSYATMREITSVDPRPPSSIVPDLPELFDAFIGRTMIKERGRRISASEAAEALRALKRAVTTGSFGLSVDTADFRPETRYAQSGDVSIAYQVIGDGAIDIVHVPGWVSNVEYAWEEPSLARFYRRLASLGRLILFDKRGTGLSDQSAKLPSLEQRMDDVRAVMDAAGSNRAVLFGASEGGNMCVLFSATYPERTEALITIGIYAKRIWAKDYPWAPTPEVRQKWYDTLQSGWGGAVDLSTLAPSAVGNERFERWWSTYLRLSASPGAALALGRTNTQIDVREILPAIRVPTLVLHRTGDLDVHVDEGRYIAARIPGARFVELAGPDHLPWVGDQDAVLHEIERFLENLRRPPVADRTLATVLVVELGTARDATGDAERRPGGGLLAQVRSFADREIDRHRGRLVAAGDARLVATFDGPARGIRAGYAIGEASRRLGISTRIGLHTGECEVSQDGVRGLTVSIAQCVAAAAGDGEVLVTGTIRDLVAGSNIEFEDRGERTFEGVEGTWRICLVRRLDATL